MLAVPSLREGGRQWSGVPGSAQQFADRGDGTPVHPVRVGDRSAAGVDEAGESITNPGGYDLRKVGEVCRVMRGWILGLCWHLAFDVV